MDAMVADVDLPVAVASRPGLVPATVGAPSSVKTPVTRTVSGNAGSYQLIACTRFCWEVGTVQSVVTAVLSSQYEATQLPLAGTLTLGVVWVNCCLVDSSPAVVIGPTEATPS